MKILRAIAALAALPLLAALAALPLPAAHAAVPRLAACAATCSRVSYLPVAAGSAVILNSGSTNASGYRIVLAPDGSAQYVVATSTPVRGRVPSALTHEFFADLHAASSLKTLPHAPCLKSVSFGTSLFVWWRHERSPDLSCAASGVGRVLAGDAVAIARALRVPGSAVAPVLRPLPPGEFHRAAPPASSPTP